MSSNDTTLSLKTKKDVKELAQLRAKQIGLPLGTVINLFLREFGRSGVLHLEAEDMLSERGKMLLREAEVDIKRGDVSGPFETLEEFEDYLNSL